LSHFLLFRSAVVISFRITKNLLHRLLLVFPKQYRLRSIYSPISAQYFFLTLYQYTNLIKYINLIFELTNDYKWNLLINIINPNTFRYFLHSTMIATFLIKVVQ
jgi:hypothetical protein